MGLGGVIDITHRIGDGEPIRDQWQLDSTLTYPEDGLSLARDLRAATAARFVAELSSPDDELLTLRVPIDGLEEALQQVACSGPS